MKKSLLFAAIALITVGLLAQEQMEVITGAGYANDVYYSLENGTVTTVARNNWDIAFVTNIMSVSVLANNGSGVELYTYPDGDISDWATLDTAGLDLIPMYNSIETFDEGAFNRNIDPENELDYGWGLYNVVTHNITGDSLFVIKTLSGAFKKLAIVKKIATANSWEFKYSNLDGTGEQIVTLNAQDYSDKYFIHYSIDSTKFVSREPAKAEWDLLFTKYYDYTIPYSVTGVLTNDDHVLAQEVRETGMDQATHSTYKDSAFKSNISMIGYDWKKLNESFSYDIIDTVVYYIKSYAAGDSSYYKLYFTGFSGSAGGGVYTFMQEEMILGVSTRAPGELQMIEVYPNPASDHLNLVYDQSGDMRLNIIDVTGRSVYSASHQSAGFTNMSLNIADLKPGLFFIRLESDSETQVIRFIKE